jgi:hypothetical protein
MHERNAPWTSVRIDGLDQIGWQSLSLKRFPQDLNDHGV